MSFLYTDTDFLVFCNISLQDNLSLENVYLLKYKKFGSFKLLEAWEELDAHITMFWCHYCNFILIEVFQYAVRENHLFVKLWVFLFITSKMYQYLKYAARKSFSILPNTTNISNTSLYNSEKCTILLSSFFSTVFYLFRLVKIDMDAVAFFECKSSWCHLYRYLHFASQTKPLYRRRLIAFRNVIF